MSILGSVAGILLSSVSCLKRSRAVVWTLIGRVLTSKIGSHRWVLTAPWTHNMLGRESWRRVGSCSCEGRLGALLVEVCCVLGVDLEGKEK